MASVAVHTPERGHKGLFSSRTAGGRMPLTPSPQTKAPESPSPSIHNKNFISRLHLSGKKPVKESPKSNIARCKNNSKKLELGVSKFTLTGTSSATSSQTPPRALKPKPRTKLNFNAPDRFIPNRSSSQAIINVGSGRPDTEHQRRPGSSGSAGSSVLSNAVSAFDVGFAAEDDLLAGFNRLNIGEAENSRTEAALSPNTVAYHASLSEVCGVDSSTRILAFKPAPPESTKPIDLRSQYNRPIKSALSVQQRRRIATAPERVLDAPGLADDYYLNLLDWSSGNQVAVGLERSVYVWSADSGSVVSLLECNENTYISSVKWSGDGAYVSVGLGTGEMQIWDVEESTKLRSLSGHQSRVGVMSWSKHLLSAGDREGHVRNHDVRIAQHEVADMFSHTSEVCGLEWRPDGSQLASGGNDNLVNIWDARSLTAPKFTKTNHKAAVKALAWCPWQSNLLATGGGTHDRQIHFWNTTTGARTNSIDTGSQVTSLRWSTGYKEIVSTSGFPNNTISIWGWPSLVKNIEIPAHDTRILHSCLSPDGQMLVTAAADESLKFWKLFEKKAAPASSSRGTTASGKPSMLTQMTIR